MYYANNYIPHQEIIRVNGEAGARNIRLAPQSSMLALDDTAPLVWLIQTDGGGYATIKSFEIKEHVPKSIDYDDILDRLSKLEAKINESDTNSDDQ